jgi:hypothetical protein
MIDRDVELTVGDRTYFLKPTLDSMLKINRQLGSLFGAIDRAKQLDFEAICQIIAAGAGLSQKATELLKAEVFEAGITNVVQPVAQFLSVLLDPTGEQAEESPAGK